MNKKNIETEVPKDKKLKQNNELKFDQEVGSNNKFSIVCMSFAVYLLYVIGIWLCDLFDLTCYLVNLPQVTMISRIAVVAIIIVFVIFFRKKIVIGKVNKETAFYFFTGFILFFGVFKGIIPDTSFDVQNYHILAQQPGFKSYFNQYIASGNFQFFGFILPDRLFYFFRLVLGYRMGTILNSLIMILVYLQVIGLIRMLCTEKLLYIRTKCKNANKFGFIFAFIFNESFLAFIVVFSHDMVLQTATYLVDILSIPFAIEMLRLILKENKSGSKLEIAYFALLTGIFFGMKMTNIVFIIPMLIIYIIKNRKFLSIPLFSICVGICATPACIYLIYNAVSTGNPIFPYFNSLFKSQYYPVENFRDGRWGPTNLMETILWPLYMIFQPQYHQSEIPNIWPYALLGSLCAEVYCIFNVIKNKLANNRNELSISIIFIVSLYLWAISTGHIRYFVFGFTLGGILLIVFLSAVIEKKHKWNCAIAFLLLGALLMQPITGFAEDVKGREWSWRQLDKKNYLQNIKHIMSDQQFAYPAQAAKIDVFLMNQITIGSVANLINKDSPIINYYYIKNRIQGEELQKTYKKTISNYFVNGAGVYDIGLQGASEIENHIETLTKNGFYIGEIEYLRSNVLINSNALLIYKLEELKNNHSNVIYYANIAGKDELHINTHSDLISLKLSVGLTNHLLWFSEPMFFTIEASDGNSSKIVLKQKIIEGCFYNVNNSLDFTGLNGDIVLKFMLKDKNDIVLNDIGPYRLAIINPRLVQ